MGMRNRALGKVGEDIAARFLSRKGYKIIGKNIKTFVGELDLIAKKDGSFIFVEVKTRRSSSFGPPHQSITEKKKRKLIQCASCYLKMKNISSVKWQIDVVSIEMKRIFWFIKKVRIEHFEDAIEEYQR